MSNDKIRDTSLDFDDCIGYKEKEGRPSSLADFLGISDIPETVEEAERELAATDPKKYWRGMPSYSVENLEAKKQLLINFRSEEDMLAFAEVLKQKLTPKTKSVWWPEREKDTNSLKRWIEDDADIN